MVTQGNLLASSILFLNDYLFSFFFKDASFYFAIVLVAWNWGNQVLWCNSIQFFLGFERDLVYDLSLFIYTIVEAGGMGDLLFFGVQT
jgi:hypothetical protein